MTGCSLSRTLRAVEMGLALILLAACQSRPDLAPVLESTAVPPETAEPTAIPPRPAMIEPAQGTLFARFDPIANDHMLIAVDPAGGEVIQGYEPIGMGSNYYYQITPDRETLIFVGYPPGRGEFPRVRFVEIRSWTEQVGLVLPTHGWVSASATTLDGNLFAFATTDNRQRELWLVDVQQHVLLRSVETPLYVTAMRFTADGQSLMVYGNPEDFTSGISDGPPAAEFRAADDLDLIWSRQLESVLDGFQPNDGYSGKVHEPGTGRTFRPAAVFDPDRSTMYLIHADADKLTRVEFARSRVLTQDIRERTSLLEHLLSLGTRTVHAKIFDGVERRAVISPDGSTIYMTGIQTTSKQAADGSWDFEQVPLSLRAIDARSASEVFTSEASGGQIQYSLDGDSILVVRIESVSGTPNTYEVSALDGTVLNETQSVELHPSHRLDGTPLLVSALFDPGGAASLKAFSADGSLVGDWHTAQFGNWILIP